MTAALVFSEVIQTYLALPLITHVLTDNTITATLPCLCHDSALGNNLVIPCRQGVSASQYLQLSSLTNNNILFSQI